VRRLTLVAIVALGAASCVTPKLASPIAPTPTTAPTAAAADSPAATTSAWDADLAQLDEFVRSHHPAPFTIHPESEWVATLARVTASGESASPSQRLALASELVGLLDTHSSFVEIPGGWHYYGLLPYRFSDGSFVIRATDGTLVRDRLLSIGGVPIDTVVDRLTPLVPHDNPNGLLEGVVWLINSVEYLQAAGIVADQAHPAFGLVQPDGAPITIDPPVIGEQAYDLMNPGWLGGAAKSVPEAVARRGEQAWTRLDNDRHVFLIAVNDYGDMIAAGDAMIAALDSGKANRVVFDMRYLQGGNGDIAILNRLRNDPRINRADGLMVLIGRENVSAATQVVSYFDTQTAALLVGEATPARAANFTCECADLTLPNSGFVVSVPLHWDTPGDPGPAIEPDVPMALSSVDFFAGRDPVLDAATAGINAP
jgi:hypothetical protein